MNLNKNKIPLKEVKIPNISGSDFSSSLKAAFDNIDDNFNILGNHEFIKGDRGDSVKIVETKFFNEDGTKNTFVKKDGTVTSYYDELKKCIESAVTEDLRADVNANKHTYKVFDNFEANPGSLQMVYNISEYDEDTPISSLYYVFLDGRFNNIEVGKFTNEELSQYNELYDTSCILVYDVDYEGFRRLENAFPTVYYEKNFGLCWKINGGKTGLPVQGIPGKNGLNTPLFFVKAEPLQVSDKLARVKVTHVYESGSGYAEINNVELYDIEADLNGSTAVVLIPKTVGNDNRPDSAFYFAKLTLDETDNILYAYCSTETRINLSLFEEDVINAMKRISLIRQTNVSSGMRGLFIPIQTFEQDTNQVPETQKAHLLTAASILNTEGFDKDLKTDLLFTPVKDINNLEVYPVDDEEHPGYQLEVDKYLYLNVNTESAVFATGENKNDFINELTNSLKCQYLKYKLSEKITDRDSFRFNKLEATENGYIGSRYYGNAYVYDETTKTNIKQTLTEDNTIFKVGDTYTTDHFESLPDSFKARFIPNENNETSGIYCWELCHDVNTDYDINELSPAISANDKTKYNFDKNFGIIYTTTISPSSNTEIAWFNASQLIDDNNEAVVYDGKYVIPGWNNTTTDKYGGVTNKVLGFTKFNPAYNTDKHAIEDDTALNLNYNVNVIGDKLNPTKILTVSGNINCDNISALSITPLREIRNIRTPDDLYAEAGLYVGGKTDSDILDYEFKVIPNDGATTTTMRLTNKLTSKKAEIAELKGTYINADTFEVETIDEYKNPSGTLRIGKSNINENKLGFTITNAHDIDFVSSEPKEVNTMTDVPKFNVGISAHYYNDNIINVSNRASTSSNTYLKNTSTDVTDGEDIYSGGYPLINGTDEGKKGSKPIVSKTSFEGARNFNMHRLHLNLHGIGADNTEGSVAQTMDGTAHNAQSVALVSEEWKGHEDNTDTDINNKCEACGYTDGTHAPDCEIGGIRLCTCAAPEGGVHEKSCPLYGLSNSTPSTKPDGEGVEHPYAIQFAVSNLNEVGEILNIHSDRILDLSIQNFTLENVIKLENVVAIEGISVYPTSISVVEGEEFTIKATISPEDYGEESTVEWISSNTSLVQIFNNVNDHTIGVGTALSTGNVTITAKIYSAVNNKYYTASCNVNISEEYIDTPSQPTFSCSGCGTVGIQHQLQSCGKHCSEQVCTCTTCVCGEKNVNHQMQACNVHCTAQTCDCSQCPGCGDWNTEHSKCSDCNGYMCDPDVDHSNCNTCPGCGEKNVNHQMQACDKHCSAQTCDCSQCKCGGWNTGHDIFGCGIHCSEQSAAHVANCSQCSFCNAWNANPPHTTHECGEHCSWQAANGKCGCVRCMGCKQWQVNHSMQDCKIHCTAQTCDCTYCSICKVWVKAGDTQHTVQDCGIHCSTQTCNCAKCPECGNYGFCDICDQCGGRVCHASHNGVCPNDGGNQGGGDIDDPTEEIVCTKCEVKVITDCECICPKCDATDGAFINSIKCAVCGYEPGVNDDDYCQVHPKVKLDENGICSACEYCYIHPTVKLDENGICSACKAIEEGDNTGGKQTECPNCGEPIAEGATNCKNCGWQDTGESPKMFSLRRMASTFAAPAGDEETPENVKYFDGLNESVPMEIVFNKELILHVGILGQVLQNSWPTLSDDSYLELRVYAKLNNEDYMYLGSSDRYSFSNAVNIPEGVNNRWIGYNENGRKYATSFYNLAWRHYAYKFHPHNITISGDTYKTLCTMYNTIQEGERNILNIHVIPAVYVKSVSQNGYALIRAIEVTVPRVYSANDFTTGNDVLTTVVTSEYDDTMTYPTICSYGNNINTGKLIYSTSKILLDTSRKFANTIVCNDGILTRVDDYIFGLGYSSFEGNDIQNQKEPALIYGHYYNNTEYDNNIFTKDQLKTGNLKTSDFTDKLSVIRLSDLASMLNWWKNNYA